MNRGDLDITYFAVGDTQALSACLGTQVVWSYSGSPAAPSLPSKSFVFNYNAKDYVDSSKYILKNSGQTLNMNMVFKKTTNTAYTSVTSAITVSSDHISTSGGTYAQLSFANSAQSPFNITDSSPNLTIVLKYWRNPDAASSTPTTGNKQSDVIANRGNNPNVVNWLARMGDTTLSLHTATPNGSEPSALTWSAAPSIIVYTGIQLFC